jgi:hypothetical protein
MARVVIRTMLCALLAIAPFGATAQPVAVDLELVLAVDVSLSVDEEEAALQRKGYVEAFGAPEIIAAIRAGTLGRIAVTYFEWAGIDWHIPIQGWTVIETEADARAFADRLAAAPIHSGPWTSISSAIDHAVRLFDGNGIEGTRRVIDISGDGENNIGRPVTEARDDAVARGIAINGLAIINDRKTLSYPPMPNLDLYYRHCVIGGPGAFVIVAGDFAAFAQAIRRKLVLEIAGLPHPDGPLNRTAHGFAQAAAGTADGRWVPPCDFGERRFRTLRSDP